MAIKNVIFDVGNVLVQFRYMDYMVGDLGFPEEEAVLFRDEMVFSPLWRALDRGDVDEKEAERGFIEKLPEYEDDIRLFWREIGNIAREFPYSEAMTRAIKDSGYPVYALSNYPDKLSDLHWRNFRFLRNMEGWIISGKVKMSKPEPEIYRLLESKYSLNLKECVFIDDTQANVDAAREAGMEGLLFVSPRMLEEDFARLGLEIDFSLC